MSLIASATQLTVSGISQIYLDPILYNLCKGDQKKVLMSKSAVAITSILASIVIGHLGCQTVAIALDFASNTILGGVASQGINIGLEELKEFLEKQSEKFGLDKYKYTNYIIGSVVDVTATVGVMKLGSLASNIPSLSNIPWISSHLPNYKNTSLDLGSNTKLPIYKLPEEGGIMSYISSGFKKVFGTSPSYVKGNTISSILGVVAQEMMLRSALNFGEAIYSYVTGKKDAISKYDIKCLIKAQLEGEGVKINQGDLKSQSEYIYSQFQSSEKYYSSICKNKKTKETVDTVINLYSKNFGNALKEQYSSALSINPKLEHTVKAFIEELMLAEVTGRLLQWKEYYPIVKNVQKDWPQDVNDYIKQVAIAKLNHELEQFNEPTDKEKSAYKALFFNSALTETTLTFCNSQMEESQDQEVSSDGSLPSYA
jgi:hypothetical protein